MLLQFSLFLRDTFVLWIVGDVFRQFLKFFRVSFVRSSYIENIYLAFILLRCPFLILVCAPLCFSIHCAILKKEWKCQYFSLICVIRYLLFFQSIWCTFFLFFSLIFSKNIEKFLIQSVNIFLKLFVFLGSSNSFCVFLLTLFSWAVFLPHSFLVIYSCFHFLCGSPLIFMLLKSYEWDTRWGLKWIC